MILKIEVPVISGHMNFFVEADSVDEAIEKIKEGEFIEEMTERCLEYDINSAQVIVGE